MRVSAQTPFFRLSSPTQVRWKPNFNPASNGIALQIDEVPRSLKERLVSIRNPPLRSVAADSPPALANIFCLSSFTLLIQCLSYPNRHESSQALESLRLLIHKSSKYTSQPTRITAEPTHTSRDGFAAVSQSTDAHH